jgi:hypothetical protein
MGKRLDKEYEVRIAGMINAYNIGKTAENEGKNPLEEIHKEIKRRGIIHADIGIPDKLYHEWWQTLSDNVYQNMLATTLYVLTEKFGYGKTRLERFKKEYDEAVQNTLDLDYMGDHWVKLEDYAVYLNEKYSLGLDVERIAVCQDEFDKGNALYHDLTALKGIINLLKINGYDKSAEFLTNHMNKEIAKWEEQEANVVTVDEKVRHK